MMKIQTLLNPLRSDMYEYRDSSSPTPSSIPRSFMTHTSTPKRKKIPKDAAVFTEGKFKGPVNYPPHEAGNDEELASFHRQYQIHPVGEIGRYCRHIPYNSEKKDFMAKTGRESFEGKPPAACHPLFEKNMNADQNSVPIYFQEAR